MGKQESCSCLYWACVEAHSTMLSCLGSSLMLVENVTKNRLTSCSKWQPPSCIIFVYYSTLLFELVPPFLVSCESSSNPIFVLTWAGTIAGNLELVEVEKLRERRRRKKKILASIGVY